MICTGEIAGKLSVYYSIKLKELCSI